MPAIWHCFVTIFPRRQDLEAIRAGSLPQQAALRKICTEKKLSCFDGIEFLSNELAGKDLEAVKSYWLPGGHLSAEANRIMARGLKAYLTDF